MINFIIAIAVGVGLFIGFWLITGSAGIGAIAAVVGIIAAIVGVSLYTGQRKEQISKNEEVPLETERTQENMNEENYNPEQKNEKRIKDLR